MADKKRLNYNINNLKEFVIHTPQLSDFAKKVAHLSQLADGVATGEIPK